MAYKKTKSGNRTTRTKTTRGGTTRTTVKVKGSGGSKMKKSTVTKKGKAPKVVNKRKRMSLLGRKKEVTNG